MTFLALNFLEAGAPVSMIFAIAGLLFAFFLIRSVIRLSPGNDRMRQIASAIQEGAKAYLNRQVLTISVIAVVIFILLFIFILIALNKCLDHCLVIDILMINHLACMSSTHHH